MAIEHHLEDTTLFAYAAGTLPEASDLIVASHLSLCDVCRKTVDRFDQIGGALIEDADAANMAPDSLTKALAALDGATPPPAPKRQASGTLPAPLQHYVSGDLDAVAWRGVGLGVKQMVLETTGTAKARLLLIPGGVAIPDHSHDGVEITLVLQGAYIDGSARFARGDIEVADGSVSHQPVAEDGVDCICLAVTDAPLKFSGFLPRVAQRLGRV